MAFRTQKISQMTPKGANLEATDLIEVSTIDSGSYVTRSITGQEIIDAAVGNVDWGDIGGTLSAQTDLQSALDAKVPTSRTLTINGVTQDLSANRTFTISTGITIGTTAIASGTVGRILFEGAGNVVQESGNLFWDNTNVRLGIGGTPSNNLDVKTNVALGGISVTNTFSSSFSAARVLLQADTTDISFFNQYNNASPFGLSNNGGFGSTKSIVIFSDADVASGGTNSIQFRTGGYNTSQERLRIASTGNVLINTTTDAGFKLDVNGTARVQGVLTIQNSTADLYVRTTTWSGQSRIWFGDDSSDTIGGILYEHQYDRMNLRTNAGTRMTLYSTGNVLINTTTDAGFRLDVNGTARVQGAATITGQTKIGTTVFNDGSSGLILGKNGVTAAARGFLASDTNYQDFGFVNTSISSGNINAWTFGQRQDTYFGNALGSFQIVGAYYDNTGTGSMVGGGFRVPLICNPNGDIIISGADNSINGKVMIGTKTAGGSKLRVVGLPTSSAGLSAGDIWNDAGTLKIV